MASLQHVRIFLQTILLRALKVQMKKRSIKKTVFSLVQVFFLHLIHDYSKRSFEFDQRSDKNRPKKVFFFFCFFFLFRFRRSKNEILFTEIIFCAQKKNAHSLTKMIRELFTKTWRGMTKQKKSNSKLANVQWFTLHLFHLRNLKHPTVSKFIHDLYETKRDDRRRRIIFIFNSSKRDDTRILRFARKKATTSVPVMKPNYSYK